MLGADFFTFWEVGRAVLDGHSPYSVAVSRYPPAAALAFALFGLLPFLPAFAAWCGLSVALYLHRLRRLGEGVKGLIWLAFTPFLFNLLTGQLDVIFWWAAWGLRPPRAVPPAVPRTRADRLRADWLPALAGAFLTLKPQLAAGLNALPLLYAPDIYGQWLGALSGVSEMKMGVSGGIFVLGGWGLPFWLLALTGAALALWGLFQDEKISRAAQLSAFPLTIWYDDLLLTTTAPSWLLVPLSWLAFGAAAVGQNSIPFILIPLGTLGWLLWTRFRRAPDHERHE